MSHFSVLVITAEQPSHEELNEILLPWHEFECTGYDRYIVDVDLTEEKRLDWETGSATMLRKPDGTFISPFDPWCYREPTPEEQVKIDAAMAKDSMFARPDVDGAYATDWGDGKGHRFKVRHVPEGCEQVEGKHRDFQTFLKYLVDDEGRDILKHGERPSIIGKDAPHKYGYIELDEAGEVKRVIRRTNPNHKWDWWALGGRWTGMLAPPDYNPHLDPRNYEQCWLCAGTPGFRQDGPGPDGKPGPFECNGCKVGGGNNPLGPVGRSLKHPPQWVNVGNQDQKKSVPLTAAQDKAEAEAREKHRKVKALLGDLKVIPWQDCLDAYRDAEGKIDYDKARSTFWEQPAITRLKTAGEEFIPFLCGADEIAAFNKTEDEYAASSRSHVMTPFAYVYEGKWYERGEMGWFGCVSDETPKDEHASTFHELFAKLPDDTWLTVVDCHI